MAAYTPELSQEYSAILRRIAWGIECPMTTTLNLILDHVVERIDSQKVCNNCKDNTICAGCVFNRD